MTVRSSLNTTPIQKLPENKIPLQTLINNNLWKARGLNTNNTITIKTPKGTFTLCPKTQRTIFTPPPQPINAVHLQVEASPVKRYRYSLLCSRNFQNVKLMLDFVEI